MLLILKTGKRDVTEVKVAYEFQEGEILC